MKVWKVAHLFCGIGGGALGFQQARREYRGLEGSFENVVGVDCDAEACADYEYITGGRAAQMDLFSREQYTAWHGHEPPEGWREVTAEELRAAAGDEDIDLVFTSPPCKGFSALLPGKAAETPKYQALNGLTIRGIRLAVEAWRPALIFMENVPRITSRGSGFLSEIKAMLAGHGYVFHEGMHDLGEIGGLGQKRQRYLLIARLPEKLPAFVYRPRRQRLKSIGEVIGPMPMPGNFGRMHELPNLQWKTWMRLALIPAGGDWRDLERCGWENLRVEYAPRGQGPSAYGVMPWEEPAGAVTGNMRPTGSTPAAVADPRMGIGKGTHTAIYRICRYDGAARTVTGATRPAGGALCIADPRLEDKAKYFPRAYKVTPMEETAGTVTGGAQPSSGAICVADPRPRYSANRHGVNFKVTPWENAAGAVTGGTQPSEGALSVADPRPACKGNIAMMGVQEWGKPAGAVTGTARPSCGSMPASVADPRIGCECRSGTFGVMQWEEPSKAVTGNLDVHTGAAAVADVRIPEQGEAGRWVIISEDGTWHRPLTTLELAALQDFPVEIDGRPLQLAGNSEGRWRERIGNAVPVGAAEGMANAVLDALLANEYREVMYCATAELWVKMRLARLLGMRGVKHRGKT